MPVEPEIIPPGEKSARELEDERRNPLARLVSLLDDAFRIPGTRLRFGIDPLIGLLPGVGDALGAVLAFLVIFAGWRRGLPKVTLARMLVNNALDGLVGTIPILGDVFDFAFKSNRRNYNLLLRAERYGADTHTRRDWLFLLVVALVFFALAVLPLLVLFLTARLVQTW